MVIGDVNGVHGSQMVSSSLFIIEVNARYTNYLSITTSVFLLTLGSLVSPEVEVADQVELSHDALPGPTLLLIDWSIDSSLMCFWESAPEPPAHRSEPPASVPNSQLVWSVLTIEQPKAV